jgi:hypothetical protein
MQVNVYEGETLVGTATLDHLDPPMGVAFGPFWPTGHFEPNAHANVIDGEYVGDKGRSLTATAEQHGSLAASVAIMDCTDRAWGKEVTLFFQDGENFAAVFAAHPDYEAYYRHLDNGD